MKKEEKRNKTMPKFYSQPMKFEKVDKSSESDEQNSSSDERRDRVQSLREGREIQAAVG